VRKENKFASKALLSKVGKTLMGRLSYIRHQNQQKSSFGHLKKFLFLVMAAILDTGRR
jgi:hypothetical protein